MTEGYSRELSSCGFWPGGGKEGAFYSYAYPEPEGFSAHRVEPNTAYYSDELKEFLLPYEAVRTADDPDHAVARFLQTTYEAAANLVAGTAAHLNATRTACCHAPCDAVSQARGVGVHRDSTWQRTNYAATAIGGRGVCAARPVATW